MNDVPLWQFYGNDELAGDSSNWFGPNIKAVVEAFDSAGFDIELRDSRHSRATFNAAARPEPEYLKIQSYETTYGTVKNV